MQGWYETYGPRLMVITWLGETADGSVPDQDGLMEWVNEFGLTHIVASGFEPAYKFSPGGLGLPSMNLIAPGGEVVVAAGRFTSADIEAVLPE